MPVLSDYIAIPALSPGFDGDWAANGHLDRAVDLITSWCRDRPIPGMTVAVHRLDGLHPGDRLRDPGHGRRRGRGARAALRPSRQAAGDGGLARATWVRGSRCWRATVCTAEGAPTTATRRSPHSAPSKQCRPPAESHPRCVVLIEGSEESGSPDLPAHVEALADVIGTPQLIVCLDSGAADYEHLWITTSLRGMAAGNLTVRVVEEGLHSGGYGGFVPDGFRILRRLLERIEDSEDGRVLLPEAWVDGAARDAGGARAGRSVGGCRARGRGAVDPGRRSGHRRRPARGAARHHLAAPAHRGRPGRPAAHRPRRQRAAPGDDPQALAAPASARRPRRGARRARAGPHHRPALRRAGHASVVAAAPGGGPPRRPRRGSTTRCRPRPSASSAPRRCSSARVAPSRSWRCSASASPGRSSS